MNSLGSCFVRLIFSLIIVPIDDNTFEVECMVLNSLLGVMFSQTG